MVFNSKNNKQVIVILGSGWGGFNLIKKLNRSKYHIIVISPRSHFLFTPLLFGSATKTHPIKASQYFIKDYLPQEQHIRGICTNIDFKNQVVTYELIDSNSNNEKHEIQFNKLVVSVGATPNDQDISGVRQNALFMNQIPDAIKLYDTVLAKFEEAKSIQDTVIQKNKLHFIVVGGGPTGVETMGELRDFVFGVMSKHYPTLKDKIQLSLFHRSNGILTSFPASLSKRSENHLKQSGIELISDRSVKQVEQDYVILDDGSKLNVGFVVWATGNKPVPLIDTLKNEVKVEQGKLVTNPFLQLIDHENSLINPNCFALGDCSLVQDNPVPATAQVASQQAAYLVKKLNKRSVDKPFKFFNKGNLAYLGAHRGAANLNVLGLFEIDLMGILGAIVWRGAYWTMSYSFWYMIYLPLYWIQITIFGKSLTPIGTEPDY